MTAEVAVMNAQAIALAADSAVTLDSPALKLSGSARAFSTADKIFGVTPRDPIAAMVYGSASFMGVPWETVLKAYRRSLGRRTLATVADYAQDFANFLRRNMALFPTDVRLAQVRKEVRARFLRLRDQMELTLEQALQEKPFVTRPWVERALAEEVNFFYHLYAKARVVQGLDQDEARNLVANHRDAVLKVQEHVLQDLPLSRACESQLGQMRVWFLTRFPRQPVCHVGHTSGVVFAGFGESEYFPSIVEVHLDSIVDKTLRHLIDPPHIISRDTPAAVLAFGQSDMVEAFMTGMDPHVRDHHTRELREFSRGFTDILLTEVKGRHADARRIHAIAGEALKKQLGALERWRERQQVKPALNVIQSLPKDELATVAESLVSLTSLKRRVLMDSSVGGPIDVCVVSKHDGCVWVKKKQYFSADLNPGFFTRKHIAWEELSNAARIPTTPETGAQTVPFAGLDSKSLLPQTNLGSDAAAADAAAGDDDLGSGDVALDA